MSKALFGLNAREHLIAFSLGSLGNGLLLFEESWLASQAGLPVDVLPLLLVQQLFMALLILSVAAAGIVKAGWRWLYVISSILFAGYAGWRMFFAFAATLELVGPLETKGIPISEYQGSFYVLALAAAISYLLMILVLRKSYGKLSSNKKVEIDQEISR